MKVLNTYIVRDKNGNLQVMYEAGPDQFGPGPFYYMTTWHKEARIKEVHRDEARKMIDAGPRGKRVPKDETPWL